ncbi:MAG: Bax inhibitor-1/YccA family protein [Alphaproteobacteria bacterium]|nr:Bax inhibitor-1/YccA family protein [Alphaproteobacteria bacterium]
MSDYENVAYRGRAIPGAEAQAFDQGLRTYMLGVYQYLMLGIALTGAMAWALSTQPALMQAIWGTPLKWLVVLAPLPVALYAQFRIERLSPATAQGLYWLYAGLVGLSMSLLFAAYTGSSIAKVFFITAAAFGALSLYGYTTQRNLSAFGSFLFIGMIGILIAMVVNIFLQSPVMQFAISIIGVLVFAGLTAFDTQRIKQMYYEAADETTAARYSILGALWLYISFVAMFQFLMSLLGDRE